MLSITINLIAVNKYHLQSVVESKEKLLIVYELASFKKLIVDKRYKIRQFNCK